MLKNILSMFIERTTDEPTKQAQAKPNVINKQNTDDKNNIVFKESGLLDNNNDSTTRTMPAIHTDVASYNSGSVSQDALDYFNNLLKENNFPGTDYEDFIETVDNPAFAVIPSEKDRFAAAFAGLSSTGLTIDKLLLTAQKYIDLVDADLKNINTTFIHSYNDKVQSKRDAINEKNKEMQDLSKQIEKLNAEVIQLRSDSTESENTLTSNKNSFVSAGEAKKEKIKADIKKIQNFLS